MKLDPKWIDYMKKSADAAYLIKQENTLMASASFFKAPDHKNNMSTI